MLSPTRSCPLNTIRKPPVRQARRRGRRARLLGDALDLRLERRALLVYERGRLRRPGRLGARRAARRAGRRRRRRREEVGVIRVKVGAAKAVKAAKAVRAAARPVARRGRRRRKPSAAAAPAVILGAAPGRRPVAAAVLRLPGRARAAIIVPAVRAAAVSKKLRRQAGGRGQCMRSAGARARTNLPVQAARPAQTAGAAHPHPSWPRPAAAQASRAAPRGAAARARTGAAGSGKYLALRH